MFCKCLGIFVVSKSKIVLCKLPLNTLEAASRSPCSANPRTVKVNSVRNHRCTMAWILCEFLCVLGGGGEIFVSFSESLESYCW